ncbi:MAG: hypothetical protein CMF75_07075 [Maricaulis sp.]|nr:hypothetical protein [Maricaulis sp.]
MVTTLSPIGSKVQARFLVSCGCHVPGFRSFSVVLIALAAASCASAPDRNFTPSASNRYGSAAYGGWSAPSDSPAGSPVDARSLLASSSSHQKVGNPYSVSGRTYYPARDDNYDEVGIASWYGPNFHGRSTANGENFDQNLMTAAHTTLPIPSIAEVTNLENGRSIIVRINDRGPFVDDRIIDLSRAAATELDYIGSGLARVRVRYLGPAQAHGAPPPRAWYAGQGAAPALSTTEPAQQIAMAAPEPVMQTPAWTPAAGERFTLQIGAFSEAGNAQRFASRIEGAGDVWIEPGQSAGTTVYRVFFGRWADEAGAHQARSSLADWGVYDARVVDLD